MNILEESLQKRLNDVTSISASIYNIYSNLFRLEKEGKKDSKEFTKYVSYLRLAIEVEEEKIAKITRHEEEMNKLHDYLTNKHKIHDIDVYYDFMYLDKDARIATRIIQILETNLDDIYFDRYAEMDEDEEDYYSELHLLKVYSTLSKSNVYKVLKREDNQLRNNKELDTLNVSDEHNKSFKELFLEYKYNMALVDKNIERSFKINNFNVSELKILKLKEQAEVLNVPLSEYKIEKLYCLSYDVIDKVMEFSRFTIFELLLRFNAEKRILTIFHLINTFRSMNYTELLEIKEILSNMSKLNNLDEDNKETIFALIDRSIEEIIKDKKNEEINKDNKEINKIKRFKKTDKNN